MANNNLILRTLNSPYVGNAADFTKNSVLSHKDVDNNFIFLKGEDIITGSTSGTTLVLTKVNTNIIEVDLLPLLDKTDNFTTGTTLIGHSLYFDTKDTLSAYTVDLSPISGDTNTDNFTTGSTLIGTTVYYNRTDAASAFTTDLGGLLPSATDYGNIIFVSEVGSTGDTRNDVVGNINTPVDLEWASQIAQSGDTIHVKAGTYISTTTGVGGLSVNGVNHYFEPGAKVYKSTSGPMFSKFNGVMLNETNVYGSGSFYGSGSCGYIFNNFGIQSSAYTQSYEWDICENSSNSCYWSIFNGHTILRGKTRMISSGGDAIYNSPSSLYNLTVNCPEIRSTIGAGVKHWAGGGAAGSLTVNATNIEGASITLGSSGIDVTNHGPNDGHLINAGYVNYVRGTSSGNLLNLTLNVTKIEEINFGGTHIVANGHIGKYTHNGRGVANLGLVDRCWGIGSGVINATLNGSFSDFSAPDYNLISSVSGNIICNYKLQNSFITSPYTYGFTEGWVFSNAGGTMNMLGNWDVEDFWFSQTGGRLNIPAGTVINVGPIKTKTSNTFGVTGETFSFSGADVNIGGTIIERCATGVPCNTSQSAHTYSNTLTYVNDWGEAGLPATSTRIIYNGATIIVRDQDSQIITTPVTGGTIGIYSAGLNTNKTNAFEAEQEKLRVSVTGTSASLTVNGETFTSTTGATAEASAAELVVLVNASGTVAATASQDTSGTDEYIYVEADMAGDALTMVYGTNTLLDTIIRYNTKAITDTVGGTLIEDTEIIKDQYN